MLISTGHARGPIDSVLCICNQTSGKMGYAIAIKFMKRGTKVILVSEPVNFQLPPPALTVIPVSSTYEIFESCVKHFDEIDIAVFSAAVTD